VSENGRTRCPGAPQTAPGPWCLASAVCRDRHHPGPEVRRSRVGHTACMAGVDRSRRCPPWLPPEVDWVACLRRGQRASALSAWAYVSTRSRDTTRCCNLNSIYTLPWHCAPQFERLGSGLKRRAHCIFLASHAQREKAPPGRGVAGGRRCPSSHGRSRPIGRLWCRCAPPRAPLSWEGRVEHVVSGQVVRFHSSEELLAFLARVLTVVQELSCA
jgi:hypothetical protein